MPKIPNPHPRRYLAALVVMLTLAVLVFTSFVGALANPNLNLFNYLPLILREETSTATATSTPANTAQPTPTKTAQPTATNTPVPAGTTVMIMDFSFQPKQLTVHVGEKVEWVNHDGTNHTVTSDTLVWNSGTLTPGDQFKFTFNSVGDFPYHCSIHPEMTGTIHVIPNP